jgi:hypothetical protein|tara:strand:+ start:67 stop:363 length:297 start_codon:yes stop_codon:yes gene_type:complete
MTEEIKTFIDNLASGDNAQAGEAFKDALRAKVANGLDTKRKEMASQMFNTAQSIPAEAAAFSDPKPEVAEPGTFEQDGSVSSVKDGSAEIDLTTDENK